MARHDEDEELLPGTRRLLDNTARNRPSAEAGPGGGGVGHDSETESLTKHGDIVLVPQPTSSPNDPLNWSLARKIWHSALACYVVILTAATSNVAGSAAVGVNEEYGISYDVFNTGAGVLFIGIGYWTLLGSPAVHLYGRRILYLVGMVWGLVGNLWFGYLRGEPATIWSQLFVGASESVGEAAVQLSLLDIWFEHQNGTSLGFYTFATAIGTYVGPLLAGHVANSYLGWRWIGFLGAIFSGGSVALLYFGFEETTFHRKHYEDLGVNQPQPRPRASGDDEEKRAEGAAPDPFSPSSRFDAATQSRLLDSYSRPKSYWERIALVTPAPNLRGLGAKQYGRRLFHTLRVFTFPAVWFAGLQWGMQNVALSFYLTVQQDHWIGAPWYYGDDAVGNMNIATLIGSLVGCLYGGYGSDRFIIWASRRSGTGGIVEAEMRLWLMAACAALLPAGLLVFGVGSARGWDWPAPYVGLGLIGFGYGCAGDLSITYLADCYPDMVLEGMVGVAVINNTLAMVLTFVASYWLDTGLQNCFIELAVLGFVISMSFLPMALYGKRARRWTKDRYLNFVRIRDGMDG